VTTTVAYPVHGNVMDIEIATMETMNALNSVIKGGNAIEMNLSATHRRHAYLIRGFVMEKLTVYMERMSILKMAVNLYHVMMMNSSVQIICAFLNTSTVMAMMIVGMDQMNQTRVIIKLVQTRSSGAAVTMYASRIIFDVMEM